MSTIKKWTIYKIRHATEELGLRSYKSRNCPKVNVKSFIDDDSHDEEGNISEHGNEEGYLFSAGSE